MWIFPVVILRTFLPILFIRAENHNKLVFLLFDSLKDIDHHFPGLIIRRFHIKPGCRNSKNKRLFPGTHTGFNHIKNVIRRPCMTFVADSTMRIQTVLVPVILGKRFKSRCCRFHDNRSGISIQILLQCRTIFHHLLGSLPTDFSLVLIHRCRIDLRPGFSIEDHHI